VNEQDTSAILGWRAWSAVLVWFRRLEDCAMRALLATHSGCKLLIQHWEMWGYLRLGCPFRNAVVIDAEIELRLA